MANKHLFYSTFAALSIALSACSGGGGTAPGDTNQPVRATGMLSQATSAEVLEASIKRGLTQAFNANNAPLTSLDRTFELAATEGDAAAAPGGGFTTTYTIEQGVGEADLMKYDGELLYTVQRPYYCPDCEDGESSRTQVNIVRTDPQNAGSENVGVIELQSDLNVEGMYLPESGRLVVLQSSGFFGVCGVGWSLPWYWENQTTRVSFFDTSNPASPQEISVLELDGAFTASRRVDGNLYLVSRYTPSHPDLPVYYSAEEDQLEAARSEVEEIALSDLLPDLNRNGQEEDLFAATDCYVPTDTDAAPESASLTTISVIPLNDPDGIQSTCYTGDAYGMYMSTNALYLTSQRYEYTDTSSADFSTIHKFDLDGHSVDYRGSAEIPGTLGHGEQLGFRISEHNDLLRVITSEYDYSVSPSDIFATDSADAGADSIDHRVTILRESSSEVALDIVSVLPNESRPAEIGKPDERLYGVRFFGDRAYMVTFERIDPLYVLDLSNPEDPFIAGELEVPGVADFLHPVSDELLLTIGRDAITLDENRTIFGGLKLELMDVSDISMPQSLRSIVIGDRGSYSEALYDRHAFTYQANFPGNDGNARLAIPVDLYEDTGSEPNVFVQSQWVHSGIYTFVLNNLADAQTATLASTDRLITETPSGDVNWPYNSGQRRSVFHDNSLYAVSNGSVEGVLWSGTTSD